LSSKIKKNVKASEEEVNKFLELVDIDHDGKVTKVELKAYLVKLMQ
jgi:Ca2+-binding EF-hand superfamily protein